MPLGHPVAVIDGNFPTPTAQRASYFHLLRGTEIVVSDMLYWICWANEECFPSRQRRMGAGQEEEGPFQGINNSNNDLCNLLPGIYLPFYACELTFPLCQLSLLSLLKHLCKTCLSKKLYVPGFLLMLWAWGVQEPLFFMQSTLAEHLWLHTHAISIRLLRHVSDFRLRTHAWKIQILHILNVRPQFWNSKTPWSA